MSTETPTEHHVPRVVTRPEQPYLGIRGSARDEQGFRDAVDRAFPLLYAHLAARDLEPAGPAVFRYRVVEDATVPAPEPPPAEFDVAVPVATAQDGDGEIRAGVLPAGRWAVTLHRGGYATLPDAHAVTHTWVAEEGLRIAHRLTPAGTAYVGAFEQFVRGPIDPPEPEGWETLVAYLLAD
jgi:effector-binding domain-containing protein